MDTQMKKKTYQRDSIKSPLLANQAIEEMKKKGYVTMICPKCKTIPEVIMKGNKTIVKCECGYVSDMEIEF